MSAPLTLDRSAFQTLLASAFVVQESRLEPDALLAFLEVQRSIRSNGLDARKAIEMIAERARLVSHADGVAVALAEEDQFVYRAGSGIAAGCIGSKIRVMLFFSGHREAATRILKIENSQGDPRTETAICRQFDAQSLLLVPIYNGDNLAGVLQVLYRNPHSFLDREVSVCRLIVSLTEEALVRGTARSKATPQIETAQPLKIPKPAQTRISAAAMIASIPAATELETHQEEVRNEDAVLRSAARIKAVLQINAPRPAEVAQRVPANVETAQPVVPVPIAKSQPVELKVETDTPVVAPAVRVPQTGEEETRNEVVVAPTPVVAGPSWMDRARGTVLATMAQLLVVCRAMKVRVKIRKRRSRVVPGLLQRALPVGLVLGMLGGVSWLDWQLSSVAYGSSPKPAATANEPMPAPAFSFAAKPTPAARSAVLPDPAQAVKPSPDGADAKSTSHPRDQRRSGFKQVRVGPNETDFVADDVTMRVFHPNDKPVKREKRPDGKSENSAPTLFQSVGLSRGSR